MDKTKRQRKPHKQCPTNPTNNVLQTPQTMFYKPHKQCSTNTTNNVLQTPQTMFYKPHKQCSTNTTNNVLQTMFYKHHKQCSTNTTNNVLQTPQTMFYKPETRIKTEQHEHTKKNGGEVSEAIVHLNTTDPRNAHKVVSKSVDLICVKSQYFFYFPFIT